MAKDSYDIIKQLDNKPEAYEPPSDDVQSIVFRNGTVLNFVSKDASVGSGRGLNTQNTSIITKNSWFYW